MSATAPSTDHHTSATQALQLLKSEYLEMPGLRLTVQQASRLLALDANKTEPLLEALVDTGFLRRTPTGFIRA